MFNARFHDTSKSATPVHDSLSNPAQIVFKADQMLAGERFVSDAQVARARGLAASLHLNNRISFVEGV
jgi:hypothetical protein